MDAAEPAKKSSNRLNNFLSAVLAAICIALVAAMLVPNYIGDRRDPKRACISNLKTIEGVKGTWALENHKPSNAIPTDAELFGETRYLREKPRCPLGGKYTLGSIVEKPRCSIPGHTI